MRIELRRDGRTAAGHPAPLWGFHAGKIWTATTDSSSRQSARLGLSVYGMVLSNTDCYGGAGTFIPVGKVSRYMTVSDAILADFEQHMVFAPEAVWLWLVLGAIVEGCLVPKAEVFNVLPPAHQAAACSQDWRLTAAVMCAAFCEAISRDEYVGAM